MATVSEKGLKFCTYVSFKPNVEENRFLHFVERLLKKITLLHVVLQPDILNGKGRVFFVFGRRYKIYDVIIYYL